MSDTSHDTGVKPKKKSLSGYVFTAIPVLVAFVIIGLLFRGCSESRSTGGGTSSSGTSVSSTQTGGNRGRTVEVGTPAQAAPIAVNDICAAYSTATQMCPTNETTGTGYVGFVHDAPDGYHMCNNLPDDQADTPPGARHVKEIDYVLDDGTPVKYKAGDPKPNNILAVKKVPMKAMMFIYYLAAKCKEVDTPA